MKNNNIVKLAVVLLLGVTTACSSFLDVEPKTQWTTDSFFDSDKKVDLAIAGMLSTFSSGQAYGENLSMSMVYGTDEGYYARGWDDNWPVSCNTHVSNSLDVEQTWMGLYKVVNNANLLIDKIEKESFSEEKYNQYIAEARFLRALAYQNLASWWNEVPLRTSPTTTQADNLLAVSTQAEVYAQIEADYKFAALHLLHSKDANYIPGRPNKMAAEGLLARAYMKMATYPMKETAYYDSAKIHIETIFADGWHELRTSTADSLGYRLLFKDLIGGNFDLKESMFEIVFKNNLDIGMPGMSRIGNDNGLAFEYKAVGHPSTNHRAVQVSPLFSMMYEGDDKRRRWNIPGIQYTNKQQIKRVTNIFAPHYTPGKFRRWEPANWDDVDDTDEKNEIEEYVLLTNETTVERNTSPIDFPVLRYSDVLLMYAEAVNAVNGPTPEAIAALDQVRQRAGLEAIQVSNPEKVGSQAAFFEEIVDERFRELAFEGIRKHDLIRWEKLGEKLQALDESMKAHPNYDPNYWTIVGITRAIKNFDPSKHLALPYPLQELNVNTKMSQREGW